MAKKILVVDDSALMRRVLCDIISSDSEFEAKDYCKDGQEAYEKIKADPNKYDGIVLDVNMPRMDGLQLLEALQKEKIKVTVIMVSTLTTRDADVTMQAIERGAIDFVTKPTNVIEAKGEDFKASLLSVLSAVFRTRSYVKEHGTTDSKPVTAKTVRPVMKSSRPGGNKLVAVACSTGGPKALHDVIPYLSGRLNAPVVLVQHMPKGFTKSMAERLDEISKIRVKEAEDGERLEKGCVYIAPGGYHIEVRRNSDGSHSVVYNDMPAIGGLKPCANVMYDSISNTGYDEIVCVVLTGMGADGTKGILSLGQHKPIHVIAQNAETCVVYGMPRAIAEAGVVDEVVPLKEVAKTIIKNVGER